MRRKRKTKNKSLDSKPKFASFLISVVFLGLAGVMMVNSVRSIMTAYKRNQLLDQAKEDVYMLRKKNLELDQRREEVMGETYVETEARDRMYYSKDGEVVVVLPDTSEVIVVDEKDAVDEQSDSKDGWWRWWKLMKNGI